MPPLVTAYIYNSFSSCRAQGFSVEQCAEFDNDDTIELMIKSLEACGLTVVPVEGIKQLVSMLAEGKHESWDLAFPTAEGMYGVGREAQVSGLLEAYQIPHAFCDAATLSLTHHKGHTKMVLEHMGIPTAPFTILPALRLGRSDDLQSAIAEALAKSRHPELMKFPLFIKPASEGSSKGIYSFSKVRDMTQLEHGVRELHSHYPDQDILIETFLGGFEYSVSIIGTGPSARIIGTMRLDWKATKKASSGSIGAATTSDEDVEGDYDIQIWDGPEFEELYPAQVLTAEGNPEVQQTEDLALRAWRALGGRDTCRMDLRWGLDGLPYVLEVNALPGMQPNWSNMTRTTDWHGISHQQLIQAIVDSTLDRYPHLKLRSQSSH